MKGNKVLTGDSVPDSANRKTKKSRRKAATKATKTTLATQGAKSLMSITPLQYPPHMGILILDNSALEAFLGQRDSTGTPMQTLMMLDPTASGGYNRAQVTAAYQRFSAYPNAQNRPPITVYGFYAYAPGTTVPLLHVV
jgi:hypothetical protein